MSSPPSNLISGSADGDDAAAPTTPAAQPANANHTPADPKELLRQTTLEALKADSDYREWEVIEPLSIVRDTDRLIAIHDALAPITAKWQPKAWEALNVDMNKSGPPWDQIEDDFSYLKTELHKDITTSILLKAAQPLPVDFESLRAFAAANGMPALDVQHFPNGSVPNIHWNEPELCANVIHHSWDGPRPEYVAPSIGMEADDAGRLFLNVNMALAKDDSNYEWDRYLHQPSGQYGEYQNYEIEYLKRRLSQLPTWSVGCIRLVAPNEADGIITAIHSLGQKSSTELIAINVIPINPTAGTTIETPYDWSDTFQIGRWSVAVSSTEGSILISLFDRLCVDEKVWEGLDAVNNDEAFRNN